MRKVKRFIRNRILLPIANWLSGSHKRYSVFISKDGVIYEAQYHRARYWYDDVPITIRGILDNRKIWHVRYLDRGSRGVCACEMFGCGPSMLTGSYGKVTDEAKKYLDKIIDRWVTIVKEMDELKEGQDG